MKMEIGKRVFILLAVMGVLMPVVNMQAMSGDTRQEAMAAEMGGDAAAVAVSEVKKELTPEQQEAANEAWREAVFIGEEEDGCGKNITFDIDGVRRAIAQGADVNCMDGALLTFAVAARRADIVQILLDAGADMYGDENSDISTLAVALVEGNAELLAWFFDKGVDINKPIRFSNSEQDSLVTPLAYISYSGNAEAMRLVLDRSADSHSIIKGTFCMEGKAECPLAYAMSSGHVEMMRLFLDRGVSVNEVIKKGTGLISHQVRSMANIIAEKNNYRRSDGIIYVDLGGALLELDMSLLEIALYSGNYEMVELFLARNVNVDTVNSAGMTMMMLLAKGIRRIDEVRVGEYDFNRDHDLMSMGSLARDAYEAIFKEMLRAFVLVGADLDALDQSGKTVFDYANKKTRQLIRKEQPVMADLGLLEHVLLDADGTYARCLPVKDTVKIVADYLVPLYKDDDLVSMSFHSAKGGVGQDGPVSVKLDRVVQTEVARIRELTHATRIKAVVHAENAVALALPEKKAERIVWSYLSDEHARELTARRMRREAAMVGANTCKQMNYIAALEEAARAQYVSAAEAVVDDVVFDEARADEARFSGLGSYTQPNVSLWARAKNFLSRSRR